MGAVAAGSKVQQGPSILRPLQRLKLLPSVVPPPVSVIRGDAAVHPPTVLRLREHARQEAQQLVLVGECFVGAQRVDAALGRGPG